MPRALFLLVWLITAWVHPAIGNVRENGGAVLDVSTRARFLRPGEVVLLSVSSAQPLLRPEGTGFGVALQFWPAGSGKWQALVGVPLETAAGAHEIVVQAADATDAAGATASATASLNIERGRFLTRQLKVADRYAEPPASVMDRIVKEAATLEQLFAQSQSERLWRGPFSMPVPGPSAPAWHPSAPPASGPRPSIW